MGYTAEKAIASSFCPSRRKEPKISTECPENSITFAEKTLPNGEVIGGRFRCTSCGRQWEMSRGTGYLLGDPPECPDCGNKPLVEIDEQNGHTLVCFACGLETSPEDIRQRRLRRRSAAEEAEEPNARGCLIVGYLLLLVACAVALESIWRNAFWSWVAGKHRELAYLLVPLAAYVIPCGIHHEWVSSLLKWHAFWHYSRMKIIGHIVLYLMLFAVAFGILWTASQEVWYWRFTLGATVLLLTTFHNAKAEGSLAVHERRRLGYPKGDVEISIPVVFRFPLLGLGYLLIVDGVRVLLFD